MTLRLLVTGAAGSVGAPLVRGLTEQGVEVRGLDHAAGEGVDVVAGLADAEALDAALAGVDAVVHLAAIPNETGLATALESHVMGTWQVLEAMRRTGVRRIVLASSNHAVGMHERAPLLGTDVRPRPDTFYGVGKVASEALCSLYVDRHGLEAVCLRIGSVLDRPTSRRALSTWLSPADAVRLVHAAATADLSARGGSPDPGFAVAWGVSANTRSWWDPAPGRSLGYAPQDDAEDFAAEVEATPATDRDTAEGRRVGGPYTLD